MDRLKSNYFYWLIALALGVAGTFQYHLAQFRSGFDNFFGDRGDPRGIVALCEHWYQSLSGQAHLLSPNFFYPVQGALGYSEFLLGFGVPYSILRAFGFEMFSALEAVVVTVTFLSYLSCFVLLYNVLRFHLLAACAGAMFFAFSSPKFFQLSHVQLQFVVCLPLLVICVILFARHATTLTQRRAFVLLSLAGVAFNIQLLTAFYHAWFFTLWCFLFLLLSFAVKSSRRFMFGLMTKFWPAIVASAAITLIGALPFMLIYLPRASRDNWYTYDNVKQMIPKWWSFLSMGDGNYLWGWLAGIVRPKPMPEYWGELTVGIGVFTSLAWIAVTAFAIWLLVRSTRLVGKDSLKLDQQTCLLFVALMILATSISYVLGMQVNGYSAWRGVYEIFPGAKAIRAMSRYVIVLTLPMALAFAIVIDYCIRRIDARKKTWVREGLIVGLVLLVSLGVIEQFGIFKVGGTGFSKKAEQMYLEAMAAKISADCSAFYVATRPDAKGPAAVYQYDAMLLATMKRIPTLNGSSSQFPPGWFGLYHPQDPGYEAHVKHWIEMNDVRGKVCRVELSPPPEAFDPSAPFILDDPAHFIRQQHSDLESRAPTVGELNGWLLRLNECKPDSSCRGQAALEIFRSTQFFEDGTLILRLYEVGLGRIPSYDEFVKDMTTMHSAERNDDERAGDKFMDIFMARPEFAERYAGLSDTDYQMKLYDTAQLQSYSIIPSQDQTSRREVLLRILQGADVSGKLSYQEWITLHYFGYLQRDPDSPGVAGWLDMLNQTGDFRRVTQGFIGSPEYRVRVSLQRGIGVS